MNSKYSIQLHYGSLELITEKSLRLRLFDMLSSKEQKRLTEFVSGQQANQYLLGRAMLRSLLSQYVPEVMPSEWIIATDEFGKPQILGPISDSSWKFNISHSEDVVVLAISEGQEVGIDIEHINRPTFVMSMAQHYFASSEVEHIKSRPKERRIEYIAQFWSLKESYLKAFGLGMRVPLKELIFSYEGGDGLSFSLVGSARRLLQSKTHYEIELYGLGSEYVVALTYELPSYCVDDYVDTVEWLPKSYLGPKVLPELKRKRKTLENICSEI